MVIMSSGVKGAKRLRAKGGTRRLWQMMESSKRRSGIVLAVIIVMTALAGGTLHSLAAWGDTIIIQRARFGAPGYSVGEEDDAAAITVTLDTVLEQTVTVDFDAAGGTATAGDDYVAASGTLTFTPGVTSQIFSVFILDDMVYEPDETVTLTLSNAVILPITGTNAFSATITGTNPVALTILDDDPSGPFIVASDYRVIPGQTITIYVNQHAAGVYELAWVDDSFAVVNIISSTLEIDVSGARRDVVFTVPDDKLGTFSIETRLAGGLIVRSASVEVVTPSLTYLPLLMRNLGYRCPPSSDNQYTGGTIYQVELDNPVRPAHAHADKNIELRGYTLNTDPGLQRELVDYGSGDPIQVPQLATLFDPYRVPNLSEFSQVHQWNWASSPAPGTRGDAITNPPVTALGLQTTPGETLYVPTSGYDIGGGMEVMVLFADEDTVALKYTRDDSAGSPGYTVHVDKICTDPNLLALYETLDDASGSRYVYVEPENRPYFYDLPNLSAGQPIGVASGEQVVVAITDTGAILDPRSCNDWWQIRPNYGVTCLPAR